MTEDLVCIQARLFYLCVVVILVMSVLFLSYLISIYCVKTEINSEEKINEQNQYVNLQDGSRMHNDRDETTWIDSRKNGSLVGSLLLNVPPSGTCYERLKARNKRPNVG